MGEKYTSIPEKQIQFMAKQRMYFIGTATSDSRVNISPKGMDSFRVLSPNHVLWLNVTGSGNESAAHLQQNNRMTIMFCSFEKVPLILRLYGKARTILTSDDDWDEYYGHFEPLAGARQIFDVSVDLVHTSCGYGVPLYDFVGQRPTLNKWAEKKGEQGIKDYWQEKNSLSLDDEPIIIAGLDSEQA
ncbi:MAG: pyridoxamine 5'-phosphate oxidase family protein [Mariprofundaceae bacterium]|nr:pyridoxamine 5'-phosphate oxidase family protein [Mariprofundaceae bacterium]